ncbi:MAG: DUF3369 domain-containing protein [Spirochaetales bacterium]|nr:DUF3369 domain-containing protein [Spirochaetales bacterium]
MTEKENDTLHFLSEDSVPEKGQSYIRTPWKIIVADDDEEVHAVTALALSNFQFKGRALKMISAYSARETERLIEEHPDTAVILLDVVMEHHDSGLELVRYIRNKAENSMVRIILRTGQPGYAPEMEVILNYDINDYKEKTELTSSKLVTTLIASLRNFDDLQRIEQNRKSLELVAAGSLEMHGLNNKEVFGPYIISSLSDILKSFSPDFGTSIFHGYLTGDKSSVRILNGSGEFSSGAEELDLMSFLPRELIGKIENPTGENKFFYHGAMALLNFKSAGGRNRIIFINYIPELNPIQKSILLTIANHIITVFNNIELMDEQKKTENEIRKSLDEKLILVKEIHHRVKNNLQIISSLLHMQSIGVSDPKLLEVLQESENRVQSMSLVHEKLYQSDLMATIDFNEYLSSLAERLIHTYNVSSEINLKIETDPLMLSINTAIPCGLIVNEILTNSIKYAFPEGRNGIISILMKVNDSAVSLTISDDGIGLPANFDPSKAKSLGTKLIRVLTDQIDGELIINSERGTTYTLNFSESAQRES